MLRIVLGFDASPDAQAAVDFLRALPLAGRASVLVVTIGEVPDASHRGYVVVPGIQELLRQVREEELREAEATARLACHQLEQAGIEAAARGEVGKAGAVLLRVAREAAADLVVVGAKGVSAVEQLLIGSVAEAVLSGSSCPVLVVRPGGPLRRVLVAVDGSPSCEAAVDFIAGRRLPQPEGVDITVLSVARGERLRLPLIDEEWLARLLPGQEAQAEAEAAAAKAVAERARQRFAGAGFPVAVRVEAGRPAERILAVAGEVGADLTVLGRRGLTGVRELMLGSVSREVVNRSLCSVLVVGGSEG